MTQLIKINYEENSECPTVLGRELHEVLEVGTPYNKWFPRMCEYGFTENEDYMTMDKNVHRADGTLMPQIQHDHQLTIEMAKEICMIQRTDKGKQCRQYFLEIEKAWNTPEKIMARALKIAQNQIDSLKGKNLKLMKKINQDKPKVLFADAVAASKTSILIGELAKLLVQNGVENIGQKRLFSLLREKGYLISRRGSDYNMPTQRAMELKLFEIKETVITHSDGHTTISKTPKVTGKGQLFFINKFCKNIKPEQTESLLSIGSKESLPDYQ